MPEPYAYRVLVTYPGDPPLRVRLLDDPDEARALSELRAVAARHPHARCVTLVCADGREIDGRVLEGEVTP